MRCNSSLPPPISTHALREEGDSDTFAGIGVEIMISTHALREEGDGSRSPHHRRYPISTHALREEGDRRDAGNRFDVFISTHALREEGDGLRRCLRWLLHYFYPRPPRGGRLRDPDLRFVHSAISTHALREEGDLSLCCHEVEKAVFLPTPSARRATASRFCMAASLA